MRRRPAAGFTLIEVAIALAILGAGVVACLEAFGGSLRLQDRGSRETRAVLHARAVMDALLFQPEVQCASRDDTTEEGFRWHSEVRLAGPEDGVDEKVFDLESERSLLRLQVDVTWQDGAGSKTYTVASLRMGECAES